MDSQFWQLLDELSQDYPFGASVSFSVVYLEITSTFLGWLIVLYRRKYMALSLVLFLAHKLYLVSIN